MGMMQHSQKRIEELEREAEEDFGKIVAQEFVKKKMATKVLNRDEKTIREYVREGKLEGYRDKDGYRIRTVSMAAFQYKIMANLSRETRYKAVYEILDTHHLIHH